MSEKYGDLLAQAVAQRIHVPVAALADIDAIPYGDRIDGMGVRCTAATDPSSWMFLANSTSAAGADVRAPTDALGGRWHRDNSLSAGGTGGDVKDSVRVATTTALAANTRTGNVLLANANGALGTIDGVTLIVGNRILIKDEGGSSPATSINNGIYTVTALGAAGSKFSFTRAVDADTSAEVTSGMTVEVEEGTANANKFFTLVTANPITLNTTAIGFDLFAGLVPTARTITATAPLQIAGTTSADLSANRTISILAATALAVGAVSLVTQTGVTRSVRGVVTSNVADLTAFTVAGNDGLTYAAGERVLLAKQTTTTQDGIYVVGTVGGGTAPLTLVTDYATTSVQPAGLEININEGTLFGNRKWFASLAGAITVGTSSPAFYPRKYVRVTGVMTGTPGIMALTAEWILSATKSTVTPVAKAPGTQGFLSIGTLTAGAGDGAVTVTSTANETSTLQIMIEN